VRFEFYTAAAIVFGRGELARVGELARPLGTRALLVRDGDHLERTGTLPRLAGSLGAAGIAFTEVRVRGEPDVEAVEAAVELARAARPELVIGLGGGSALDTAKAVAGLTPQPGTLLDHLEVVGRGQPLAAAPLPVVAIPTTAGTGAEVTQNAVIAVPERRFKASIRSPRLVPRLALVDPALTDSVPPDVTAATGLDALTQLIEPYVSCRAQPLTDGLALMGIRLVAGALERAFHDGADTAARDDLALAALLGGICLANAGLGAVHGFAAPLGASFPVPHGVACAALLPYVMRANVAALRAGAGPDHALRRYAEIGALLAGPRPNATEDVDAGIAWVAALVRALRIPPLGAYGVTPAAVPDLVIAARQASSMRGNPIVLGDDALAAVLVAAL